MINFIAYSGDPRNLLQAQTITGGSSEASLTLLEAGRSGFGKWAVTYYYSVSLHLEYNYFTCTGLGAQCIISRQNFTKFYCNRFSTTMIK
jgi:hypothetical protein